MIGTGGQEKNNDYLSKTKLVDPDKPILEQKCSTTSSRIKRAILSLLKTLLNHLPLLSINFLLLGAGSVFLSESSTTIDKKTINGHHAQATVTGHLTNNNTTVSALEQKHIQLLEERIKDKEELLENNMLLLELYQERIASLEEEVERLRGEDKNIF